MFGLIHTVHIEKGHPGRDIMQRHMTQHYANVTTDFTTIYRNLCLTCGLKKVKSRRGVVVKPILTPNAMSRGQVDLIDMQSQPDGEFKFVLVYQDHFTKYVILRPLKQKTARAVAECLIEIFSILGPPTILQSDNGREFKNQEIKDEVLSMWPGLKMVNGKPRHSQSQGSVERANQDVEKLMLASRKQQQQMVKCSSFYSIPKELKLSLWHKP